MINQAIWDSTRTRSKELADLYDKLSDLEGLDRATRTGLLNLVRFQLKMEQFAHWRRGLAPRTGEEEWHEQWRMQYLVNRARWDEWQEKKIAEAIEMRPRPEDEDIEIPDWEGGA
jgi:hypothetical protein